MSLSSLFKLNYFCWFVFFITFNLYCVFWRQYAVHIEYNFNDSLVWFAKEWVIWLLLSPLVLWWFEESQHKVQMLLNVFVTGFACLGAAFITRMVLNSGEYLPGWMSIVVVMLPKYFAAYLAIFLAWYFNKIYLPAMQSQVFIEESEINHESRIELEHKGLRIALCSTRIYSLKATGNYVEISYEGNTYLKRSTLKQLLSQLPDDSFAQVHRSYVINLDKLIKLANTENGSGIATLSNQQNIPVSKGYKANLKSKTIPFGAQFVPESAL